MHRKKQRRSGMTEQSASWVPKRFLLGDPRDNVPSILLQRKGNELCKLSAVALSSCTHHLSNFDLNLTPNSELKEAKRSLWQPDGAATSIFSLPRAHCPSSACEPSSTTPPSAATARGSCHLSGSTLVCILYSSFECPPFLMHFLTFRVFSHNKARVKTDTVINYRFQKHSASRIEGLEKGLCLLLPLLCLPSKSGHWFCLWLGYRLWEERKHVPQCWPWGNYF